MQSAICSDDRHAMKASSLLVNASIFIAIGNFLKNAQMRGRKASQYGAHSYYSVTSRLPMFAFLGA
jgi:hypothetical protein